MIETVTATATVETTIERPVVEAAVTIHRVANDHHRVATVRDHPTVIETADVAVAVGRAVMETGVVAVVRRSAGDQDRRGTLVPPPPPAVAVDATAARAAVARVAALTRLIEVYQSFLSLSQIFYFKAEAYYFSFE